MRLRGREDGATPAQSSVLRGRRLLCLPLPALKVNDDAQNLFRKYREQELEDRRNVYR